MFLIKKNTFKECIWLVKISLGKSNESFGAQNYTK